MDQQYIRPCLSPLSGNSRADGASAETETVTGPHDRTERPADR
ncbi:hypothetical protein SAMN04489841_0372 [Natrinema salaciae]|uniref:Uncharacterized protein n=1 Tax=Natrinema salaciae TaxID=1186196 RepID=A0A1H9A7V5_9EURY|nr:hypothetical protein SAMN04489841_0372 [Natrinema salaciae]